MKPAPFRATLRACLAAVSLAVAALLGAAPALAQDPIPPPQHSAVDANGVDLISGEMSVGQAVNSIGPNGPGGLSESRSFKYGYAGSSTYSFVKLTRSDQEGDQTLVAFMGRSQIFGGHPDSEPQTSEGNTLSIDANWVIYTLVDGTVAKFARVTYPLFGKPRPIFGKLQSVVYPSGEILTFSYGGLEVESSLGYAMVGGFGYNEWDAIAANLTQGGCANGSCSGPTYANQQTLGRSLLKTPASAPAFTVEIDNPAGGATRSYVISVSPQRPNGFVTSVSDGVGTWTYTYSEVDDQSFHPGDYIFVTTVADLLGNKRVVTSRQSTQNILSDTIGIDAAHPLGQTTTFQYGDNLPYSGLGRLNQITAPEGNWVHYEYDYYNSVTAKWNLPKGTPVNADPSMVAGATVVRASYNTALCVSMKVCNRPDWIEDARGNRTDFTYDPAHGGVRTITKPAVNGVRPQTRFTYGQFTARYIQNGNLTAAPPVWRLVQTSTCATMAEEKPATPTSPKIPAACIGTADEVVTTYAYEPSNVANNVRLLSTTTRSGDNALSATTTYAYDARGDVVTVDGPLAGTADTTRTYYDASRWKTGQIGPDPDGAGPLRYRASRNTYYADGQIALAEIGTATSQSDAGMSSFIAYQQAATEYNAQLRKAKQSLIGAGATQTVAQYAYDAVGRPTCTAVRMNPAVFDSLPTSACALGTQGADGPDRITYTAYDNADRPTQVTSGYATTGPYAPRVEKTVTYTANGLEATVADGRGNLTTYDYDGLDRLVKVRYPNASGTGSSTTDYEEYGYDAVGNRASWRRRDGTTVAFTYDALNRANNGLRGEAYGYDNLGRRTLASLGGDWASIAFDALGRVSSESANSQTTRYQYNLAGARTRITWPDEFYVTYGYDASGAMTDIFESSGARIAAYGYDDLGRRSYGWSGLGSAVVWRSYGYDAASRLASLSHDVPGIGKDQTWTFGYNAAGQVKSRASVNAAYDWTGVQTSKTYGVNGLNQMTSADATTISYTSRGNLKNDGFKTYCYDLLNNLTSVWLGAIICNGPTGAPVATLTYDPVGRLNRVSGGATLTGFIYAGTDVIGEVDGGNVFRRRYIPGPGTDEPVAWYEGAGTSDRRWLSADYQGSIISTVNSAGAVTVNTYDEYGIPAAGNLGRFQYTGQAWIPEIGLYHYKARAYSPTLGRFLQTDPIGYMDGLNWYAYVGNDPVNGSDPTGMVDEGCGTPGYPACPASPPKPDNEVAPVTVEGRKPTGPERLFSILFDGPRPQQEVLPDPLGRVPTISACSSTSMDSCISQCAAASGSIAAAGGVGWASGQPILETRGKFGGATAGTSPASSVARMLPDKAGRYSTLTGSPKWLGGRGVRTTTTTSRNAAAARDLPWLSAGLSASAAGGGLACSNMCMEASGCSVPTNFGGERP